MSGKRVDWLLSSLIDGVSDPDDLPSGPEPELGGVPITLAFSGMVIAGDLIAAQEYFKRMAEWQPGAADTWNMVSETSVEDEREAQIKMKEISDRIKAQGDATEEDLRQHRENERRYIHLANTRMSLDGTTWIHSSLWRGQLVDVMGWSFGTPGPPLVAEP